MKDDNTKEDRHVWEIGKGRVVISNGKVVSVAEPLVKYCPIHEAWIGAKVHTIKTISRHTRWKIQDFGLCTKNRRVYSKMKGIGYGCSETLMTGMQNQLVDAVVIACDGAGTVITDVPEVEQGIGGPMNALIETSPIPEVISKLQTHGAIVLDPDSAKLNTLEGVKIAIIRGYKRIGAIVVGPQATVIEELRQLETRSGVQIIIFVVHTTGVTPQDIKYIEKADMAHGCASKLMREHFDLKARKKFGSLVPVYALSEIGEKLLTLRDEECLRERPSIVVGDKPPPDLI